MGVKIKAIYMGELKLNDSPVQTGSLHSRRISEFSCRTQSNAFSPVGLICLSEFDRFRNRTQTK